ncbi:hypothetical protein [Frankia sp. AgKG'84/4]|uniref:hypothetical protein n=1 Tax=Frankia sp. AgKG'84/4 TaxID=573490 RepID=UPI00200D59DF|nr:hypothetical protein [Frankia sp. AgKG'84/4]MCL9793834.1 hypothetical protein [Frankia sp. AgKG'84/4]
MIDYTRAHRFLPSAGCAAIASFLGWWWAGGTVPLPEIVSGLTKPVQLQLIIMVALAPATVWMFSSITSDFERVARRSLLPFDALALLTLLGPVVVSVGTMYLAGDGRHAPALLRDALCFVGLALLCLGLADETAALTVPVAYFMAVATFGGAAQGQSHVWAYVRADFRPGHLVLSAAILLAGAASFTVRHRRY